MDNSLKNLSNGELMLLYQQGRTLAFEEIYNRFEARVFLYLMKRLHKRELADEVFQNVFFKFHQLRDRYQSRYILDQWIFVIARSVVIDFLRKEKRHTHSELDFVSQAFSEECVVDFFEDERVSLDQARAELGDMQRKVVDMKIIDEAEYNEIASALNISESNARKIFSRGLLELRKMIGGNI